MVRMSGYKYLKLVHGILCRKLPPKSAETRSTYVIHHANDMYSGGSETEMSRRSLIRMIIHRYGILATNKDSMHFLYNWWAPNNCLYISKVSSKMSINGASTIYSLTHLAITRLHSHISPRRKYWPSRLVQWQATRSLPDHRNQHQRSVNDFWSCILHNQWAVQQHLVIIGILAAFMGKNSPDNIASTS